MYESQYLDTTFKVDRKDSDPGDRYSVEKELSLQR